MSSHKFPILKEMNGATSLTLNACLKWSKKLNFHCVEFRETMNQPLFQYDESYFMIFEIRCAEFIRLKIKIISVLSWHFFTLRRIFIVLKFSASYFHFQMCLCVVIVIAMGDDY